MKRVIGKKRRQNNKKVWIIILIICVVAILIGACYEIISNFDILKKLFEGDNGNKTATTTNVEVLSTTEPEIEEITAPNIDATKIDNPIDFIDLKNKNDEIYAWIYIPGTKVNYPVCQSKSDDNFYLHNNIYKKYQYEGAIYSQAANTLDFTDRVTVLYGHNMADHSMFGDLHKFEDEKFFYEHKDMYVYTPSHKLTYEIIAAYQYDSKHILNTFDFSDDSIFENYLDSIKNPKYNLKNVRKDLALNTSDRILTLSTCLNSGYGRYLVQGVLITDELTE